MSAALVDVLELLELLEAQVNPHGYRFGGKAGPLVSSLVRQGVKVDCSGFIQWGTSRYGHALNGGSDEQLAIMQLAGLLISVDEAIATPGALLVIPSRNDPGGNGHIAMSRGDGTTIEAHDTAEGIGIYSAAGRFFAGGKIPGFIYGEAPDMPLTAADVEAVSAQFFADMAAADRAIKEHAAGGPPLTAAQDNVVAGVDLLVHRTQAILSAPAAAPKGS